MRSATPDIGAQNALRQGARQPHAGLTADVIAHAAEWYAQLHSGDSGAAELAEFERWRQQDAGHAEAYARMEKLWARFDTVSSKPAALALNKALKSGAGKREKLTTQVLLLCIAVFAAWFASQSMFGKYMLADYRTAIGEQRVIELSDQSRITLNTQSAIDIDFSGRQRRITLQRGEIMIDVAKDSRRPFIVETAHGTARALGTQYIVKREADATRVTVLESSVQACAAKVDACVTLTPGEQTTITPDAVQPVSAVNVQAAAAWSKRMLVVDDQPLAQVLTELARYRYGRIVFNADEIAGLRVSGVYALDDTDRTLEVLLATTPIRIKRYTPLLIVVQAAK
ncbi:FecR family protein [Herminiimonas glaciei]|uniref:FecR family protein n=1 Tax=Herminiimonas glaciei TaxID=523788 RepID=A0ABW2I817_9BURK